ncbi:DUF4038 domain-containing protein, partial [bacterium]|nr:DUF4038 domain-containing protein [bacterium]
MHRRVMGAILLIALSAGFALATEKNDAEILSTDGFPETMSPGDTAVVSVKVKNTGSKTWYEPFVKLGADEVAKTFVGGHMVPLKAGDVVHPGDARSFDFTITAPKAGSYDLGFQMKEDPGSGIFGKKSTVHIDVSGAGKTSSAPPAAKAPPATSPPAAGPAPAKKPGFFSKLLAALKLPHVKIKLPSIKLPHIKLPSIKLPHISLGKKHPSPPSAPADDAKVASVSIPDGMPAGTDGSWSVEVENTGTATWDEGYRLGVVDDLSGDAARFIETTGAEPNRVHLPAGTTVAPGEHVTFTFAVKAPTDEHAYSVKLRMVHEGVIWFGETASTTVTVTTPPVPASPPGLTLVLDDPLKGSTKGSQHGGTLTPDGYRIDAGSDYIVYDLPTLEAGVAEFSASGLVSGSPGATEDAELIVMYDGDFSPDPESDYMGYRNNTYKFFLRKMTVDTLKLLYKTSGGEAEEYSPSKLSWDPATTYRFRVEWGEGAARFYRDGELLKSVTPGGVWKPTKHRLRIGTGGASRGWPGTVTKDLKVWSGKATLPGAPSGPPPMKGHGPHVVRDSAHSSRLATTDGKPFFWVGKTAFALSAQPKYKEFIDEAAKNGVNVLRILVGGGRGAFGMPENLFPFVPGGYDEALFSRLDDVVAYAGMKEMACELVIFEVGLLSELDDPTTYNDEKKKYVEYVVTRYRDTPNVIWEVANEYTHASGGPHAYGGLSDSFVQAVQADVRKLDPHHLIGLSDQGSSSPPSASLGHDFDLLNYHIPRDADFWKNPWKIFIANADLSGGRVQINDEPIGSDTVEKPGKRSSDGSLHRANAWVTAVAQGY